MPTPPPDRLFRAKSASDIRARPPYLYDSMLTHAQNTLNRLVVFDGRGQ